MRCKLEWQGDDTFCGERFFLIAQDYRRSRLAGEWSPVMESLVMTPTGSRASPLLHRTPCTVGAGLPANGLRLRYHSAKMD